MLRASARLLSWLDSLVLGMVMGGWVQSANEKIVLSVWQVLHMFRRSKCFLGHRRCWGVG